VIRPDALGGPMAGKQDDRADGEVLIVLGDQLDAPSR
jgi:hypothetical protein